MHVSKTPVVIIGAGPTGLTAAICLALQGIECLIIDKRERPIETSNALGAQPRTLEIWNSFGIVEKAIEQGQSIHQFNMYQYKNKMGSLSLKNLPSPYPFLLGLPQAQTEKILTEKFISLGGIIHRNLALVALSQKEDFVELTVENENKQNLQIVANWVLGCDGTHSVVRKIIGFPFAGQNLQQHFIMADLNIDSTLSPEEVHAFISSKGVMAMLPLKSFFRIIFDVTLTPALAKEKNPPFMLFEQLARERCGFPLKLHTPIWTSAFRVREHVVNRYRSDNVFLLGDAAHEHSPIGAQGMNTGIQDAYNLCWKIAMVEKKMQKAILLDSYELERLPVAKNVVKFTTIATKVLASPYKLMRKMLPTVMKINLSIPWITNRILPAITNLNIQYKKTPSNKEIGNWKKGIKPGCKIPYLSTVMNNNKIALLSLIAKNKYTLLIFTGLEKNEKNHDANFIDLIKSDYDNSIDIIMINYQLLSLFFNKKIEDNEGLWHQAFGADEACMYLIIPDHYVAMRSKTLKESIIADYLN